MVCHKIGIGSSVFAILQAEYLLAGLNQSHHVFCIGNRNLQVAFHLVGRHGVCAVAVGGQSELLPIVAIDRSYRRCIIVIRNCGRCLGIIKVFTAFHRNSNCVT